MHTRLTDLYERLTARLWQERLENGRTPAYFQLNYHCMRAWCLLPGRYSYKAKPAERNWQRYLAADAALNGGAR